MAGSWVFVYDRDRSRTFLRFEIIPSTSLPPIQMSRLERQLSRREKIGLVQSEKSFLS